MSTPGFKTYFVPDGGDGIELPDTLTVAQAQATLQHSMGYNSVAGARAVTNTDGTVTFQRAQGTDKG